MTLSSFLGWMICGLIVGAVARFLVPGRQAMSVPMTIVLGIVGALLGGFFYSLIWGTSAEPFTLTEHNWHGWIVSILGGVLVVWLYPQVYPRRWWQ